MEVMEAIKARYSARNYSERKLDDEAIRSILEAGRLAPTARNQQMNKHIIVTDPQLIQELAGACKGEQWIATAPAVLVECAANDRLMHCGQSARSMDGAIAMAYMTLQAVSLGMQFCWLGWFEPEKVKTLLHIPEDYVVIAVAPVGYAAAPGKKAPKKQLEEVAAINSFEQAYR